MLKLLFELTCFEALGETKRICALLMDLRCAEQIALFQIVIILDELREGCKLSIDPIETELRDKSKK